MGIFWTYFRDTLKFPLIGKEGALAQVAQGGAAVLDDVREVMVWLRNQFNPETCDPDRLAGFAASRGIARHRLESDGQYRARVVHAYAWQLLGGKESGMVKLLAYYGYDIERIENPRDIDPERWAEFAVDLGEPERRYSGDDFELLVWLVNDQKPARSVLAGIAMRRTAGLCVGFSGAVRMHPSITVSPGLPTVTADISTFGWRGGVCFKQSITIGG